MTLEKMLITFGQQVIASPNDWYQWKKINPHLLPQGISLGEGNQYSLNVSLKNQLSEKYHSADENGKVELTRYYIAVWGGVRRNSPEKIFGYALNPPENLISNGVQGVASWSKALCIRDPNRYAIYDARVAVSLNSLQILHRVADPELFPLLLGQNKTINKGSRFLELHSCKNSWKNTSVNSFYKKYNSLLANVASVINVEHYALEMALFAKAPELLRAAFPEEQF